MPGGSGTTSGLGVGPKITVGVTESRPVRSGRKPDGYVWTARHHTKFKSAFTFTANSLQELNPFSQNLFFGKDSVN